MATKFVKRPPVIAGAYLTERSTIYTQARNKSHWVKNGESFLPILNLFELSTNAELRFSNVDDSDADIETFNKNTSTHPNLNKGIVSSKRLDVSRGDLLVGGVRLILNFTSNNLVVKTRSDIPKIFFPLQNDQLAHYRGKILVVSFHSFNTPKIISSVCDTPNYFRNLREEMRGKESTNTTKVSILEYLADLWDTYMPSKPDTMDSNTIKIALMHEYLESDFSGWDSLYCHESGLVFQFKGGMLGSDPHPKISDDLISNKQIVATLRDHSVSCFINDTKHRIGERFFNFAGTITSVTKIADPMRPDGLYTTVVGDDKTPIPTSFTPIEKIDENQYIFKSREEAQRGTDIRQQAAQQYELDKLELNATNLQLRQQFDERTRKMELEAKERQAEYERQSKAQELLYQQTLKDIRLELEKGKTQTQYDKFFYDQAGMERKHHYDTVGMERKHYYEVEKYERDTTVETLKTVAAVAGVAATGFMIYKTLSK